MFNHIAYNTSTINATNLNKGNVVQPQNNSVHFVSSVNSSNPVRQKPGSTGTVNVNISTQSMSQSTASGAAGNVSQSQQQTGQNQFQRLKVEDALSYLDQVINNLKFNNLFKY